jgi:hypothetical protein
VVWETIRLATPHIENSAINWVDITRSQRGRIDKANIMNRLTIAESRLSIVLHNGTKVSVDSPVRFNWHIHNNCTQQAFDRDPYTGLFQRFACCCYFK